ncbi:phosphate ABC transporter permease PstA [Mogibacterium kristiansenii]|uniref:Phosphate transport system permease protein PstA n=1 Tax=Mogibacterium kristiansenii TaxID=2606708 RepID=A0A6N7X7F8_9FIRM|nr:phosphate ABC transporter permease PstA [Mogibacterium kristiansenii]MST71440.1 phosphate ABC transporter permease PstA [Mogibacterium kristiansenii]
MSTHRKNMNRLLRGLMGLCSGITCLVLLMIIGYILYRGVPSLTWNLLSTEPNNLTGNIGILPNILNTLYIIFVAMIIVLPLGVGAAIYLTEYSTSRKLTNLISFAAEILTGIPSILFGLVGMLIFIQIGGLKQGILAGALTLVLMVLPTIISNTRESLLTVPRSYREGALALGSGKWHMIRTVVLPSALDGIITGCILSVGRITSESAALLFTAGFGLKMIGFVQALQSSSATLTVALYIYASERGAYDIAFAIAIVLMALTLALNLIASKTAKKIQEKRG